jgi:hypothetical protein
LVFSTTALDGRGSGDVSHIEKITDELRAMSAGVDKAQANTAAADATAREIATRAAGAGLIGIAAGMSGVRKAIGEIGERIGAAGDSISRAATAVAAAPREMSPQQTIAVLAPAQQTIDGAHGQVAAAIAKVDETKQLAAAVLRGGQPGPMLAALEAVKQILVLLAQRAGSAKQRVQIGVREARQTGASGN